MGLRINTAHAVSEIIDGEAIIVNLKTGVYYSLGKVGAVVWDCIMKNLESQDITKRVTDSFNVERVAAQQEVDTFVEELVKESLVIREVGTLSSPKGSAGEQNSAAEKLVYETPKLVKFNDMQDLLLLDPVHEVHEQQGWPWKKDGAT